MTNYYVVHKGKKVGIYNTWEECKVQVMGIKGSIYKKFTKKSDAEKFLQYGYEYEKHNFQVQKENEKSIIYIYTDGSCVKKEKQKPIAGYGIYIPSRNIRVSLPLKNQKITNNRAELTAIIESFDYLEKNNLQNKICIFTDSQYCIYLFHGTGEKYEKKQYKIEGKEVPNVDLIKKLLEIKRNYNVQLLKIKAHTDKKDEHSIGNRVADELASLATS
jgi:ribonuclease HI